MADWRTMDRATRSMAYDNGAAVADSALRLARWKALSAPLRETCPGPRDLVYGPRPRNRVDIFTCGAIQAPLFVFIHGGYWQRNAKEDFACMALGPLARGFDVALVGYTLAPEASLNEIAAEIRTALQFIRDHNSKTGKPNPMIVSGWSAGGHLAALTTGWPGVDAVLAISGIFDLEPLSGTAIDDKLRLSHAEIEDFSPIHHLVRGRSRSPSAPMSCRSYAGSRRPFTKHVSKRTSRASWCRSRVPTTSPCSTV